MAEEYIKNGKVFQKAVLGSVDIPEGVKGVPIVKRDGDSYEVSIYRMVGLTDEEKAKRNAQQEIKNAEKNARKEARVQAKKKKDAEKLAKKEAWIKKLEESKANKAKEAEVKLAKQEERLAKAKAKVAELRGE